MLSQFVRGGVAGCVWLILISGLGPVAAYAQPHAPHNALVYRVSEKTSQLALMEKESRLIELEGRIKTVDGFDPTIVKITTVDNFHQVRLLALAPGFTSVVLVDEHGHSFTVDVLISGDVKQLEAIIRKAAPGSSVQAIKVKDNVLLLGWVDQPTEATKIVELAENFHPKVLNYLQVSGVQTIMLRVKMMEAQRSRIRSLGFNFLQNRAHSNVGSLVGPLTPLATGTPSTNFGSPLGGLSGGPASFAVNPAGVTAIFGLVAADNAFNGFIEALKTENLLTILAEPTLITTNGRPANFLSGGQFPVPVPQGLGTVSVVYKDFGVKLEFVPTVMGSGRLRMQIRPEVSEKDLSNTLTVNGITVPSLTTRSVNTEVEMNFGQTLVIAGLISNRVEATSFKVPFFGELPWIGAAFRRVRHDESETELLVLVTPELAAPGNESEFPLGPGQDTVTPTDRELYFNGYLETPRYGPDPEPPVGYMTPNYIPAPPGHSEPNGALPPPDPAPALPGGPAVPEDLPPAAESAPGATAPDAAAKVRSKKTGAIQQASGTKGTARSSLSPRGANDKPLGGSSRSRLGRRPPAEERPGLIAP
ncbi:MAG TPA: pilus assembly protein N-terminal domain-containing protein [Planctomycetaceae bacterium]|nr:pilus assembly protein N-terminal domain-containing protein [Planctomycetaceae bacterium]